VQGLLRRKLEHVPLPMPEPRVIELQSRPAVFDAFVARHTVQQFADALARTYRRAGLGLDEPPTAPR
jgi:hypothetical protein